MRRWGPRHGGAGARLESTPDRPGRDDLVAAQAGIDAQRKSCGHVQAGLGLDALGVARRKKGEIVVNEFLQTTKGTPEDDADRH
jgi:hypothetical protein